MKIILSRKGFDSSLGGVASPILPDGSLFSLPIPDPKGNVSLSETRPRGMDLGQLAADLTRGRTSGASCVHLDPDLERSTLPRLSGWRPAFGQCSAAQRHLERRGVAVGDLFLFFGWFRQVELRRGAYGFARGAPDLHVLFGWLEVGETLRGPALEEVPRWLERHPHVSGGHDQGDCIYVARSHGAFAPAGGGVFPQYSAALQLTASGVAKRSLWRLPAWFSPAGGRPPLTYHSNPARWKVKGDDVLLSTVGRGQEFVLDAALYPEASQWAASVIASATQ
jgi:hypothetical protein